MGSGDRISDKEKTILWFQVSLYQILLADGNSPPRLSEVFAWIVVGAHYHNPQATDQKKIQFFFDPDWEMLLAPTNFPKKKLLLYSQRLLKSLGPCYIIWNPTKIRWKGIILNSTLMIF